METLQKNPRAPSECHPPISTRNPENPSGRSPVAECHPGTTEIARFFFSNPLNPVTRMWAEGPADIETWLTPGPWKAVPALKRQCRAEQVGQVGSPRTPGWLSCGSGEIDLFWCHIHPKWGVEGCIDNLRLPLPTFSAAPPHPRSLKSLRPWGIDCRALLFFSVFLGGSPHDFPFPRADPAPPRRDCPRNCSGMRRLAPVPPSPRELAALPAGRHSSAARENRCAAVIRKGMATACCPAPSPGSPQSYAPPPCAPLHRPHAPPPFFVCPNARNKKLAARGYARLSFKWNASSGAPALS